MIELKLKDTIEDIQIYEIIDNIVIDIVVGGLELVPQPEIDTIWIENINIKKEHRGNKYLKQVIEYLQNKYKCNIGALPLSKYRSYFESLGFTKTFQRGEDIYYTLHYNI